MISNPYVDRFEMVPYVDRAHPDSPTINFPIYVIAQEIKSLLTKHNQQD